MNDITWEAPGAGHWALDRSHVNRPATLISQHVQEYGTARGTRRMFAELGIPAVVGAPRAVDDIPNGAIIEVDADRGEIRVIEHPPR